MEQSFYIGQRLVEERNRLGMTQKQMAELARISKRAQGNYERGERSPDADYWQAVSKIGVDIQYVLTDVRSKNLDAVAEEAGSYNADPQGVGAISRVEQQWIKILRELQPKDRTHLWEIGLSLVSAKKANKKTGG